MLEREDCVLKGIRKRFTRTADRGLMDEEGVVWPMHVVNAYWRCGHAVAICGRVWPAPGQTISLGNNRGSLLREPTIAY